MSKQEWCEHIRYEPAHYGWTLYYPNGHYRGIGDEEAFCGICGAPCLEEPKKLWEKLAEEHRKTPHIELYKACSNDNHGMWEMLGSLALDEVLRKVDEMPSELSLDMSQLIVRQELKRRLEELR